MDFQKTAIADCWLIKPRVFEDERGYFFESYQHQRFKEAVQIEFNPIQDNEAFSSYGVLRGLHFQEAPYAQAKLVRAVQGKIIDVAVDLRKNSPTFGAVVTAELSHENKEQLFVPKGCAHGYAVLSQTAVVFYKTDAFYHPQAERGIAYNDPELKIDWRIPQAEQILSEKDLQWPTLKKAVL